MSHSSEKELEFEYYNLLKDGSIKIRGSKSTYKCPFCYESSKTYRRSKELRRHATDRCEDSRRKDVKTRAKHRALERYITRYYDLDSRSESSLTKSEPIAHDRDRKDLFDSKPIACDRDREELFVSKPIARDRDHDRDRDRDRDRELFVRKPIARDRDRARDREELFVWPSMGVLANIKTEVKDGKRVAESGSKLRDEFNRKGFNPLKVVPLWGRMGHSGYAIVEFGKDWTGFKNSIAFETSFEADNCGKSDYYRKQKVKGEKLYGWVAREDDYRSMNIVGDHLRKNGDLKTISEKEEEEKRKDSRLVSKLKDTLEEKNQSIKEMERKCRKTDRSINKVVDERDNIISRHNEKIRKIRQREHDSVKTILTKHERCTEDLENQMKELILREKELEQQVSRNDSEKKELLDRKEMIERATREHEKNGDKFAKLAYKHKREKEKFHKEIFELEKQLDSKQALELQIARYRGDLEVNKHMEAEDMDVKNKMEDIREKLKEKEEDLEAMEDLNQTLIVQERRGNDELQQARKEIINGLKGSTSSRAFIGVKRMGDLDNKPFLKACESKFSDDEAEVKAMELCSLWESYLADPNWHPFKVITIDGKSQGIVDDEDEKLRYLRSELGEEVYESVIKALKEMNEYNPSGRYSVLELWNFKVDKRARLNEGIDFLLRQWKALKRQKRT